jgi:hypothetical protein
MYKSQARYYMATFLDGSGQILPEFRRFVVTARRKPGLKDASLKNAPILINYSFQATFLLGGAGLAPRDRNDDGGVE